MATNLETAIGPLKLFMETGEVDTSSFSDDFEVKDHDILDGSDDYRGREGFLQWLEDWGQAWSDWRFHPEEFFDENDIVVIVGKMTAKGASSGVQIERQDALVYRFREGLVTRIDYYNNRAQALEDAGLSAA
jgi:ketosteroid isomerase-like protein